MLALGLVLVSQDLQQPALLRHVYSKYVKVLANAQEALNNAKLVRLESKIIQILLLSLFEALIAQGRQSPKGWHTHNCGCAALLQMRGAGQLERPLGWHLFLHASNSIRSSCIKRGVEVPMTLKTLQAQAPSGTAMEHADLRLGSILENFAEIRAHWPHLALSQQVQRYQKLNDEIGSVVAHLYEIAPFEPISTLERLNSPADMLTYGDGADRYTSLKHAKHWNTVRMPQIMLNDHMYSALTQEEGQESAGKSFSDLSDDASWIYQRAAYQAEQLTCGILRSIPFALEISGQPHLFAKPLIFPLTIIMTSKLAPVSTKLFARDRLRFIGSTCGHTQTSEAAKMPIKSNSL